MDKKSIYLNTLLSSDLVNLANKIMFGFLGSGPHFTITTKGSESNIFKFKFHRSERP